MEAAQGDLWYRLLPKSGGTVIGLNHFGESAPIEKLYEAFGLTAQNAVAKVKSLLAKNIVESL
jgi:transketolase